MVHLYAPAVKYPPLFSLFNVCLFGTSYLAMPSFAAQDEFNTTGKRVVLLGLVHRFTSLGSERCPRFTVGQRCADP